MEYISSDTNVWVDFFVIGRTDIPFHLPYTFIMNCDAINDELLSPSGLREKLLQCGLVSVELTIEEFGLAEELGPRYPQLTIYDRIALAIAIARKITLLTGDSALRKVAKHENVNVLGTIGILDQLFDGSYILGSSSCQRVHCAVRSGLPYTPIQRICLRHANWASDHGQFEPPLQRVDGRDCLKVQV